QRVDLDDDVVLGDHVLARKDVHGLAQVDALGAEAPRIAVARRGDDRLMPIHGAGTVDYGENEVDPRRERLVILAEPLDDHRLRLLHHTDALRDQDDDAERDRGDEDSARTHRSELDRKSTRLNSSHLGISYAVFCLKKKKNNRTKTRISILILLILQSLLPLLYTLQGNTYVFKSFFSSLL